MTELKPCATCGTPNPEMDWSACSEIRGTCWQDGHVSCANPECHVDIHISIDGDINAHYDEFLIAKWNHLQDSINRVKNKS
jgi:hypothetical protein